MKWLGYRVPHSLLTRGPWAILVGFVFQCCTWEFPCLPCLLLARPSTTTEYTLMTSSSLSPTISNYMEFLHELKI